MADYMLYAALVILVAIAVPFVRFLLAHAEAARERRMRSHIDWVNPERQAARRRRAAIRI